MDVSHASCLRCQDTGRKCDGYGPRNPLPSLKSQSKPKPTSNPLVIERKLLPITLGTTVLQSRVPITVQCKDVQEEQYLQFFFAETAGDLSGGFDNPLWSDIVLRACNEEPCILHCAVALSALDKSCRAKMTKPPEPTSEEHHRYALRRYDTAIHEVRELLQRRQDSLRTVLIASLLIFCFESFHGDIRLALNNVKGAVELMYAWLSEQDGTIAPGHFSPAPDVIEDEIVSAYTRLDIHLLSWIDAPLPSRGKILRFATTETFHIPEAFKSMIDGKVAFDHVTNHIFQYLGSIQRSKAQASEESTPKSHISENSISEEPIAATELRQWMKAFEPVLVSARTHGGVNDFVGFTILRIHAITVEICVRSALFETTTTQAYDVFLPEFREMVALSSAIVNHPRFLKSFVFNMGFVPSLFIIVTKCRDKTVRQEAIDVLKAAHPRREGVWDCLMVARIGEELIRSEEEELRSGRMEEKIEIHLACLNMYFELPRPPRTLEDIEMKRNRQGGRGYLLDWVERCVDMNVVAGP
ncbi:uncharacterized protein LY89DRAFT_724374 [Mollisia scopiformis]|uniref:Zn(2)-C6 fungal-type domain-containing protein n=1 Tax=Mollisia scopiformis TaxID=149040 RepID=A0A132BAQ5_MOLSC|nr:uncharacterized protein LY89DRAFT_724374 [Mollisia scopiformis]KUJ09353.1 hypothetical protein LY89DRAFT_724374 [Mollisia scopiformis]